MQELLHIARFEVRYHVRQPYFYGVLLLMVAQGLAIGIADYQQLADVTLLTNAPVLLYLGFATTGPLLVATVALLTGQTLLRDHDYRVSTYLYALPITERAYFSGQLLGSLSMGILLGLSYALGLLLVPFWLNGPVGDWPVGAFFDGFARVLVPNLLVVVCLSYALTALFRHIAGAYVALLVLTLGGTLLQLGYTSVVGLDWVHLLDPFGAISIRQAVETMTTLDKNTGWPDTPELLYLNRLLWLGLSGWLITRADARLSFRYMMEENALFWRMGSLSRMASRIRPGRGTAFDRLRVTTNLTQLRKLFGFPRHPEPVEGGPASGPDARSLFTDKIPTPICSFTPVARWKAAFHVAGADARWLVRQPAVAVGLLLLALGILAYGLGVGDAPYGQRLLPYTSRMTFIRLPMHLYISLFLVVFTVELLHRNRTSGMWYLTDATPQPGWVRIMGQVGAMILLAMAITTTLLLTGVVLQLVNGQTPIEWTLYARDLLSDGLLRYVELIALAALVSVLMPNRLVGHGLTIVLVGLLLYIDQQHDGTVWWLYSVLPGSRHYSDISGYGRFAPLRSVLALVWMVVAVGLLLLATRLGQRGVLVDIPTLFRRWYTGLNRPYVIGLGLVTGVATGCFIWLGTTGQFSITRSSSVVSITPYNTTTEQIRLPSGQRVNVIYQFVHPQNLGAVQAAVATALLRGSDWLGAFPHETLHITETPFSATPPPSHPAFITLPERDGWMTNTAHPDDAGQLALAVSKQVLNQWLANGFRLANVRQSGLLTDGLAGYLALRIVRDSWGDNWLKGQLARQEGLYRRGRGQRSGREPVVLEAPGGSYVVTAKAPLSLTCIGEVWGHEALCRQIGRFYQSHHNDQKISPETYVADLQNTLPNQFRYVADYLRERPQFSFAIGSIGVYDDRLSVQIIAQKTLDDGLGHLRETLLSDYVPIALLDASGRIIHRQLVMPSTAGRDDKAIWLPRPANAASVVIDPLGAWPEASRTNNQKRLVRRAG